MKRLSWYLLMSVPLVWFLVVSSAPAQETQPDNPPTRQLSNEELLSRVQDLQTRMDDLQRQMDELKAELRARGLIGTAGAQPAPSKPTSQPANERTNGFGSLRIYGDMVLRLESISAGAQTDRFRPRTRLRVNLAAPISRGLEAHVRITTGNPNEPSSPYVTLGDFLGKKQWSFDRAYLAWKPFTGSEFSFGKGPCRFWGTELIWDYDTQPDGAMQVVPLGNSFSLALGEFWLNEVANASDASMLGGQLRYKRALGRGELAIGVGYQHFNNEDQIALAVDSGSLITAKTNRFRRNAAGNVVGFLSRYRLGDMLVRYTTSLGKLPLEFAAHYVRNFGADDQNEGFWLEAFAGSTKKRGDLRWGYTFGHIEADSVLAAFNNDDFNHTNLRGHQLHLFYALSARTELHLNLFAQKLIEALAGQRKRTEFKWRLNLISKF